jgi:hypothetical protein
METTAAGQIQVSRLRPLGITIGLPLLLFVMFEFSFEIGVSTARSQIFRRVFNISSIVPLIQ